MLLAEDGKITVTVAEQPGQVPDAVMRYVISDTRLDSTNAFLFHKTTRRELYDREWQHYAETQKADEVLYLNERGELAEGSRTNVFVERDGKLLTPPLSSGLLPGVLRNELIASGKATEAVLTLDDLTSAGTVYMGNSVRGLVKAEPLAG
jgi:para-aminobenzoate synthetase/4-amino-4-deoxychorismate lyase